MMNTKKSVLFLAAAMLTACGGGGGSSSVPAPSPLAATPSPLAATPSASVSTIITNVPTPTYAVGSSLKAAFDLLNAEISNCGFGKMAQDVNLDVAAAQHVNYSLLNNDPDHYETVGRPGFTGLAPADQANAAGYSSPYVGQEMAFETTAIKNIRGLLSSPYHLSGLVYGFRDIGIFYNSTPTSQLVQRVFVVDLGIKNNGVNYQKPPVGTVLTYPCQGSTGIAKDFYEDVNWAGTGTGVGGHPVHITAPNGEVLVITSASITPVGGGVVPVQVITSANDPQKFLMKNQAFVIPPSSLQSNTTYRVQISGTVAGVPFTKDFTETTGV
jgi:uncharacterized protein YkwD